jgi:hypothetical protein
MYKKCDKNVHNSIKEHLNVKKERKQRKKLAKAGIETAAFLLKS